MLQLKDVGAVEGIPLRVLNCDGDSVAVCTKDRLTLFSFNENTWKVSGVVTYKHLEGSGDVEKISMVGKLLCLGYAKGTVALYRMPLEQNAGKIDAVTSPLYSFNAHNSKITGLLGLAEEGPDVKALSFLTSDEDGKIMRWGIKHKGVELRGTISVCARVNSLAVRRVPSSGGDSFDILAEIGGGGIRVGGYTWMEMFGDSKYGEFWTSKYGKHCTISVLEKTGAPIPFSDRAKNCAFKDTPLSLEFECISSSRKPRGIVNMLEEEVRRAV